MNKEILEYNQKQSPAEKEICDILLQEICKGLPEAESEVWHAHPVWFLDGNQLSVTASLRVVLDYCFGAAGLSTNPG